MSPVNNKEKGLTLVELLISLGLATVVLAGLVGVWVSTQSQSVDTQTVARLHHDLQSAMRLMVNDIRRAGFWGLAANDLNSGTNTNPFMTAETNLVVNPSEDCILLSYDADQNGSLASLNTAGGDERFGFRLSNQAIQARLPSTDFSCTSGNWENVTDPSVVEVTNLTFTPSISILDLDGGGPGTASLNIRQITLQMTGRLVRTPSVTRTLIEQVRVRNDVFTP